MWDFEEDFDADLDLGLRRKPVQWVAVAPPATERSKQQVHKRYTCIDVGMFASAIHRFRNGVTS